MRKTWLILTHEYGRNILRWRFFIELLMAPLLTVCYFGVVLVGMLAGLDLRPVGYVDQAGFVGPPSPAPRARFSNSYELVEYPSLAAVQQAYRQSEIQAFVVIPPDYPTTRQVQLYARNDASAPTIQQLVSDRLVESWLRDQPPEISHRLSSGSLVVSVVDESDPGAYNPVASTAAEIIAEQAPESQRAGLGAMAVAFGLFFLITNLSGYLLNAVLDEKQNRTIEIVATSVSSRALMNGKMAGNLLAGLTPALLTAAPVIVVAVWAQNTLNIFGSPQEFNRQWITALLVVLPYLALVAALLTAFSAVVPARGEAALVALVWDLPLIVPIWMGSALGAHPNGGLALFLSFFPLTAPSALLLRLSVTAVPAWQIALSSAIMGLSALGAILLVGPVFRWGMLRFGEGFSLRKFVGRLWLRLRRTPPPADETSPQPGGAR